MGKKTYVLVGVGAGLLASFLVVVLFVTTTSGWENVTLSMTSPDCTLILHAKPKSVFPPTEFEYALTVASDKGHLDLDIPDDSSGGDPVVVYALRVDPEDAPRFGAVLIDMQGHAFMLDPATLRVASFDTYRDRLELPGDAEFVAGEVARAWKRRLSVNQWRYVATFDRVRGIGWAVSRCESWFGSEANAESQSN